MKSKTSVKSDFALEDHLLWTVHKKVSSQVLPKKTGKLLRLAEFQIGMIIPDLVVVAMQKRPRQKRRGRRIPSLFECAILAELLKRGPRSRKQVAQQLFARETSMDKAIIRLAHQELVSENKLGQLFVPRTAMPSGVKVVSVEAKLRRWKEAIQQAKNYRQFSNCSYVALPKTIIQRNNRIHLACAAEGVGLIAVSPQNTEVIVKPKSLKPITANWVWLVTKALTLTRNLKHPIQPNGQRKPVELRKCSNACSQAA